MQRLQAVAGCRTLAASRQTSRPQPPLNFLNPLAASYQDPALFSCDDTFAEARYWDRRYTDQPRSFEWYRDYDSLEPLIRRTFKYSDQIMQVGMGTSQLQYHMALSGYTAIHSVDFSQVAVDSMRAAHQGMGPLTYAWADCRSMPQYADAFFHGVLDKGTLDALLCGEDDERDVQCMLGEVARVLRPGGCYMMITYSPPKVRLRYVLRDALPWASAVFWEVGQQGARRGPVQVDVGLRLGLEAGNAANATAAPPPESTSATTDSGQHRLTSACAAATDTDDTIRSGGGQQAREQASAAPGLAALRSQSEVEAYAQMSYSHFVYVLTKQQQP